MSVSSIQYPKKQPKNFSIDDILHLNMRSLNKNFENLKASLDELGSGFQIICLTKS